MGLETRRRRLRGNRGGGGPAAVGARGGWPVPEMTLGFPPFREQWTPVSRHCLPLVQAGLIELRLKGGS